jgi:hypothetical protein
MTPQTLRVQAPSFDESASAYDAAFTTSAVGRSLSALVWECLDAAFADDIAAFQALLDELEHEHAAGFRTQLIAESPAKLRRIRDYFAALLGLSAFPPVRCNAPEFSAVVGADGRVAPCFIPAPALAPRSPDLVGSLVSQPARALRASIRAGERRECAKCVCSMWREPLALTDEAFRLGVDARA